MADIKFSEFPKATTSKDSDEIAILQDGVNKMIPSPILESKIINKTVSRVIDQGGASLNMVNLKGVVPTYADLALITPTPELNDAYQVEADGLVYVYTNDGFQADGEGFNLLPEPNGIVEEGNTQAVSGGEVYEAIPKVKTLSLIDTNSTYIKYDTVIGSTGNSVTSSSVYPGAVAIVDFPLEPNTTYSLYGFESSVNKRFGLSNGTDVIDISNLSTLPKTFTTTSTHYLLRASIKLKDPDETSNDWQNTLMLVEGTVTPTSNEVVKINDKKIQANSLSDSNIVPNPITEKNAVNKEYFDENAIRVSDIEVDPSNNLAKSEYLVNGKYIANTGGIVTATGWVMLALPVSDYVDGQVITFGGFTIQTSYHAFYNGSALISVSSHNGSAKTVTKPAGATILYIDIARPANNPTDWENLMVNLGSTLLPYESPLGKIKTLKGYEISGDNSGGGGGVAYDQSLNTTDEVQFAKVTAPIETSVLVLNLPTSNAGLPIGRAWVDTANGNVVKVV